MVDTPLWEKGLRPQVAEHWDELVQLRRTFHRYPELSHQEHRTSERIRDWLTNHGVDDVVSSADCHVPLRY